MSFLFSGLVRLNVQPTVGFEDAYIDLREPFTLKTDQLIIRLTPLKAGEEEMRLVCLQKIKVLSQIHKNNIF